VCGLTVRLDALVGLGGHLMGQKVTEQVARDAFAARRNRPALAGSPSGLARA